MQQALDLNALLYPNGANPSQARLYQLLHDPVVQYIDEEGAIRCGKTAGASKETLRDVIECPQNRICVARFFLEDLKANTLPQIWDDILLLTRNKPEGVFKNWAPLANFRHRSGADLSLTAHNGTVIDFRGVQDYSRWGGVDYGRIWLDDVRGKNPAHSLDELTFLSLLGRLSFKRQDGLPSKLLLTINPPDLSHWLCNYFPNPKDPRYVHMVCRLAENRANLRPGYEENLRADYARQPEMLRVYLDGERGMLMEGSAVWHGCQRDLHVGKLLPVAGKPLDIVWDFGFRHPALTVQQLTNQGWNILGELMGTDTMLEPWILEQVLPYLNEKFGAFEWQHYGDVAGNQRDDRSAETSIQIVTRVLNQNLTAAPVNVQASAEGVQQCISRLRDNGRPMLMVDEDCPWTIGALLGGLRWRERADGTLIERLIYNNDFKHCGDTLRYGWHHRLRQHGQTLRPDQRSRAGRIAQAVPNRGQGVYFEDLDETKHPVLRGYD